MGSIMNRQMNLWGHMQDYGLMEAVRAQMRSFWRDLDNMDLTEEDLKKLDYNELENALGW